MPAAAPGGRRERLEERTRAPVPAALHICVGPYRRRLRLQQLLDLMPLQEESLLLQEAETGGTGEINYVVICAMVRFQHKTGTSGVLEKMWLKLGSTSVSSHTDGGLVCLLSPGPTRR